MGDFNIVQDNNLDVISGQIHSQKIVQSFKEFTNELLLEDIWREQHKEHKTYTWSRNNPRFIARRLDYIFLGESITTNCEETMIKSIGFSDHRSVIAKLNFAKFKRGPGTYKMNTSLLSDKHYINIINEFLITADTEFEDLDPHLKWEMIKIRIKELSQQYSRYTNMVKKNTIAINIEDLKTIEDSLSKDPCNKNLLAHQEQLKKALEIKILEETRAEKKDKEIRG